MENAIQIYPEGGCITVDAEAGRFVSQDFHKRYGHRLFRKKSMKKYLNVFIGSRRPVVQKVAAAA